MPPFVDLFAAGVAFSAGAVVAVALFYLLGRLFGVVAHAARWHVYRPLLRRRYLRRVAAYRANLDRADAMRRHPSSQSGDAHNHTLS